MKLRNWKTGSLRRPAAALMAGVMTVSLLPAAALAARVEAPAPDMAHIIAAAQVQDNTFDFERDVDAVRLEAAAKSFPARFDLRHCDTDGGRRV